MSYVEKLRTELALQRGEAPAQFMRRYVDAGVVAPGYTLDQWVSKVVDTGRLIGSEKITPYANEAGEALGEEVGAAIRATLQDVRDSSAKTRQQLSDQHVIIQAGLASMRIVLKELRKEVPELVADIPDIDAYVVGNRIMSDMREAVAQYDALSTARINGGQAYRS